MKTCIFQVLLFLVLTSLSCVHFNAAQLVRQPRQGRLLPFFNFAPFSSKKFARPLLHKFPLPLKLYPLYGRPAPVYQQPHVFSLRPADSVNTTSESYSSYQEISDELFRLRNTNHKVQTPQVVEHEIPKQEHSPSNPHKEIHIFHHHRDRKPEKETIEVTTSKPQLEDVKSIQVESGDVKGNGNFFEQLTSTDFRQESERYRENFKKIHGTSLDDAIANITAELEKDMEEELKKSVQLESGDKKIGNFLIQFDSQHFNKNSAHIQENFAKIHGSSLGDVVAEVTEKIEQKKPGELIDKSVQLKSAVDSSDGNFFIQVGSPHLGQNTERIREKFIKNHGSHLGDVIENITKDIEREREKDDTVDSSHSIIITQTEDKAVANVLPAKPIQLVQHNLKPSIGDLILTRTNMYGTLTDDLQENTSDINLTDNQSGSGDNAAQQQDVVSGQSVYISSESPLSTTADIYKTKRVVSKVIPQSFKISLPNPNESEQPIENTEYQQMVEPSTEIIQNFKSDQEIRKQLYNNVRLIQTFKPSSHQPSLSQDATKEEGVKHITAPATFEIEIPRTEISKTNDLTKFTEQSTSGDESFINDERLILKVLKSDSEGGKLTPPVVFVQDFHENSNSPVEPAVIRASPSFLLQKLKEQFPPRSIQESLPTGDDIFSSKPLDDSTSENTGPVESHPNIPGLYVTPVKDTVKTIPHSSSKGNFETRFAEKSALFSGNSDVFANLNNQSFRENFANEFRSRFEQLYGNTFEEAVRDYQYGKRDDLSSAGEEKVILPLINDVPYQAVNVNIPGLTIRGLPQTEKLSVPSTIADLPLEDHRSGEASANVGVAVLPEAVPVRLHTIHIPLL